MTVISIQDDLTVKCEILAICASLIINDNRLKVLHIPGPFPFVVKGHPRVYKRKWPQTSVIKHVSGRLFLYN